MQVSSPLGADTTVLETQIHEQNFTDSVQEALQQSTGVQDLVATQPTAEVISRVHAWKHEFHLMLKMISEAFKQIAFGFSKFRYIFFENVEYSENMKMHKMQIRAFLFLDVAPTALGPS